MTRPLALKLRQEGRASVDFFSHLIRGASGLRQCVDELIDHAARPAEDLPQDLDALEAHLVKALSSSAPFRAQEFLGEWHARNHGRIAIAAFEEVADATIPYLKALDSGPALLDLGTDFKAPDYWDGVEFHRTAGGWDAHEFQGYIHSEIIHKKMIDAAFPGGAAKQRALVASRAPKPAYDKILDMGCSTGLFTTALAEQFPGAEIHGIDLSRRTLEQARRVANHHNWSWRLYRRPAEASGFNDATFDLVASYILLHEVPAYIVSRIFAEAFRVLKPGGDLLMSDVQRYAGLDKVSAWRTDRAARLGGEPHWRSSAQLDLAQIARAAGFKSVSTEAAEPSGYPCLVRGTKPL